MNFPILASFIVFLLVFTYAIKRHTRREKELENSFWERERAANNVRRKPLDKLRYILIPLDKLPVDSLPENDTVQDKLETLRVLSGQKIVNFTGYSNTDLKLEYGTANITQLTEYDQNYTLLVRTLQEWAEELYQAGLYGETRQVLEFAMSTGTDISKSYYLLAELYVKAGEQDKIKELSEIAGTLRSASKNAIVRTLKESYL